MIKYLFNDISYDLASKYELEHRKNISDYSFEYEQKIQKDILKKFDENW